MPAPVGLRLGHGGVAAPDDMARPARADPASPNRARLCPAHGSGGSGGDGVRLGGPGLIADRQFCDDVSGDHVSQRSVLPQLTCDNSGRPPLTKTLPTHAVPTYSSGVAEIVAVGIGTSVSCHC